METATAELREGPRRAQNDDDRVLVLAPVGRDGPLIAQFLRQEGLPVYVCDSVGEMCVELRKGVAVVVMTTEALRDTQLPRLEVLLARQPTWSDIPVLLLARDAAEDEAGGFTPPPLGNVTVLERPLRLPSFLSTVQSALRARRRQYQVRDLLAQAEHARREAERQQEQISALNQHLQQAMTETHHRVKNNLQVIAAMVDMQVLEGGEAVPVRELRRLGRAIDTLAAVHDLLTHQARSDAEARFISARAVLERLLPLVQEIAPDRRIYLNADEARLNTRQSTSLALVVNELVSNAIKYGRESIDVRLEARDDYATLRVADDGPGFPPDFDVRAAAHTGLDLVENLSRWDLAGDVTYANALGGGGVVTVRLTGVQPARPEPQPEPAAA